MPAKLTDRQEMFCREYLIDLNATQAAIRAGYSPKTANQQAARLLVNVKVSERIAALKSERVERLEIDADAPLERLYRYVMSRGLGEFLAPVRSPEGALIGYGFRDDPDEAMMFSLTDYMPTEDGPKLKVIPWLEAFESLMKHIQARDTTDQDGDGYEPPPPVTYEPFDARLRDAPEGFSGMSEVP